MGPQRRRQRPAATLLVAFGLALASCARAGSLPDSDEPRVVTIPAAKSFLNYSLGMGLDVVFSASADAGPAGLVTDGDLLAVECRQGEAATDMVLVPYRASDGGSLDVELTGNRLLLGGRLVALAGEGEAWAEAFLAARAELGAEGMRHLRLAQISAGMPAEARLALADLAAANAEIDALMVEDLPACEDLVALFQPRLIVTNTAGLARLRGSKVRSLMLCDAEDLDLAALRHLPDLRTLVLMPAQAGGTVRLPRQGLPLERLLVCGDNIGAIVHLDALRRLRQLVVMDMPESALKQVARLPCLETLMIGFSKDEQPVSLARLGDPSGLRALGLRGRVAQADFERLLAANPGLRVLELVGCDDIVDAAPVRWLPDLQVLICRKTTAPEPDVLAELTHLRLLALDSDEFAEGKAERLLGLAEQLPGCRIAPVRGMCLGSGWILLLVPLTIALALAARARENRCAVRAD